MERMQAELQIFFLKVKAEKLEKLAKNWSFRIVL